MYAAVRLCCVAAGVPEDYLRRLVSVVANKLELSSSS